MAFLLISQTGLKNVCISTRLLLEAILCVNLSNIFRGLRPRTPAALAQSASAALHRSPKQIQVHLPGPACTSTSSDISSKICP